MEEGKDEEVQNKRKRREERREQTEYRRSRICPDTQIIAGKITQSHSHEEVIGLFYNSASQNTSN